LLQDVRPTRLLLVADNPDLQAAGRRAATDMGVAIDIMPDVEAALSWLLRPERLCTHVLAQSSIDSQRIDALAGMVDEVTSLPTPLLLLGADEGMKSRGRRMPSTGWCRRANASNPIGFNEMASSTG
jgi:uncharacterized protein (DUF2384 family)